MSTKTVKKNTRVLDRNLIASLAHGLTVLEAVAAHKEPIPLATLATMVGMKKTNVWRLVHTLVQMGYVRQDPKTRSFQPAPRILSLGHAYFDGLDLKQISAPFLQDLSGHFNETVNLAVLDHDELVYIERIGTSQIININLHVGSRLPLYNTSLGRSLICEMPEDWVRAYMSRLVTDRAAKEYLRSDKSGLPRLLEDTRKFGYSLNDEELVKGLRSIASPVRDAAKQIVGAIGIAVPSSRVTIVDLKKTFVPQLLATAEKISTALGYRK
ncbi:MAG TPA: IclR family transcriptional regulator [Acidobacteriaceae bacterium]|jgi:IclR family pca regulon transcriptional regulator